MNKFNNIRSKISERWARLYSRLTLRYTILFSFTVTAAVAAIFIGVSFYTRFTNQLYITIREENESIIEQVNNTLNIYLRSMMKISDSLYYSVLKDKDLSEDVEFTEFELLYDTNKEAVSNIALFLENGDLLGVSPAGLMKETVDVKQQLWFENALDKTENMHFSNPKIQNLFTSSSYKNPWVISLSRAVQINNGTEMVNGVLLVDTNYSRLEAIFINATLGNNGYIYLADRDGNIIYHPKHQLIYSDISSENNLEAVNYRDGTWEERYQNTDRIVTVKTVGYTGWKIIGVMPKQGIALNNLKSNLFFVSLSVFFITMLVLINAYISSKVANPIQKLEKSVEALAEGNLDTKVQIAGFQEIKHLGKSIQKMAFRIKNLMQDIVKEQESKRKSELDTLQSQINPHFLYNTLDIIVWMIENERKSEAVKVVMALSRLFRISLSKGKNIISVGDELEHVSNYMEIQSMRYKNRFEYFIETDEELNQFACIKLILQPLVENAIYHGLEFMDGEGEIYIRVYRENEDLYISIEDNGLGMTPDKVERLLNGKPDPGEKRSKGSGIGVSNVNERVTLYFGEDYGLQIDSEPDEGTTVTVHLPAVSYGTMRDRK